MDTDTIEKHVGNAISHVVGDDYKRPKYRFNWYDLVPNGDVLGLSDLQPFRDFIGKILRRTNFDLKPWKTGPYNDFDDFQSEPLMELFIAICDTVSLPTDDLASGDK